MVQGSHGRIEINSTERRYHHVPDGGSRHTVHSLVRHGTIHAPNGDSSADREHDGEHDLGSDDDLCVSPILGDSTFHSTTASALLSESHTL